MAELDMVGCTDTFNFRDVPVFLTSLKEAITVNVMLGYIPGPSCSKLTTSLVNVSLKFQT